MPQHRQVDPKDLGISPDDQAIQEAIKPVPIEPPAADDRDEADDDNDE